MTDDTTSEIDIDPALLRDYIKQHRETDDREEQRRIENEVLQETVWQSSFQHFQEQPSLSKEEFKRVYQELPDDEGVIEYFPYFSHPNYCFNA